MDGLYLLRSGSGRKRQEETPNMRRDCSFIYTQKITIIMGVNNIFYNIPNCTAIPLNVS